jgi:hypothetical protein
MSLILRGFVPAGMVAAAVVLAACARQPTPFQQASGGGGGYTTQQIASNRFRVSFTGNTVTPREVVDTYLLYRAAELTLENGFDYFIIVNRDTQRNTQFRTYGDTLNTGWRGGWGWRHSGFTTYRTVPITSYEAVADIVLNRGPAPTDNPDAYTAREVLAAIGPTVVRVDPAPGAPITVQPGS